MSLSDGFRKKKTNKFNYIVRVLRETLVYNISNIILKNSRIQSLSKTHTANQTIYRCIVADS